MIITENTIPAEWVVNASRRYWRFRHRHPTTDPSTSAMAYQWHYLIRINNRPYLLEPRSQRPLPTTAFPDTIPIRLTALAPLFNLTVTSSAADIERCAGTMMPRKLNLTELHDSFTRIVLQHLPLQLPRIKPFNTTHHTLSIFQIAPLTRDMWRHLAHLTRNWLVQAKPDLKHLKPAQARLLTSLLAALTWAEDMNYDAPKAIAYQTNVPLDPAQLQQLAARWQQPLTNPEPAGTSQAHSTFVTRNRNLYWLMLGHPNVNDDGIEGMMADLQPLVNFTAGPYIEPKRIAATISDRLRIIKLFDSDNGNPEMPEDQPLMVPQSINTLSQASARDMATITRQLVAWFAVKAPDMKQLSYHENLLIAILSALVDWYPEHSRQS